MFLKCIIILICSSTICQRIRSWLCEKSHRPRIRLPYQEKFWWLSDQVRCTTPLYLWTRMLMNISFYRSTCKGSPSVLAMWKSIFIIGCDAPELTCTRLLITSKGKIATHNDIPPTPPQTIVLRAPCYTRKW